jgi:exonuclease I
MIKNRKIHEISLVHYCFRRLPAAFEQLKLHFVKFIESEGAKLVNDTSMKNDEFVNKIIELRELIMEIFQKSLNRNVDIQIGIKLAFENFINKSDRTSIAMVRYLDEQFLKDFKGMDETEVGVKMD